MNVFNFKLFGDPGSVSPSNFIKRLYYVTYRVEPIFIEILERDRGISGWVYWVSKLWLSYIKGQRTYYLFCSL